LENDVLQDVPKSDVTQKHKNVKRTAAAMSDKFRINTILNLKVYCNTQQLKIDSFHCSSKLPTTSPSFKASVTNTYIEGLLMMLLRNRCQKKNKVKKCSIFTDRIHIHTTYTMITPHSSACKINYA